MWGTTAGTLTQQVKDMGGTVLLRDEWRARYRVMNHEAVQTRQVTETRDIAPDEQDTDVCGFTAANGDVCQYTGTKRAVAVHKATTHGQRNPIRELTRINECPLCRKHFASVRTTGTHVLRSMQANMCNTKASTTKQAVSNEFHGMRCPTCNVECKELEEWQRHIAIHLMEVADNKYGGWTGHKWWEETEGTAQGAMGDTGGTQYLAQQVTLQPQAAHDAALPSVPAKPATTRETSLRGRRRGPIDEYAQRHGRGVRHDQKGNGRTDGTGGTDDKYPRSTDTGITGMHLSQDHHARDGQTREELHRSRYAMDE